MTLQPLLDNPHRFRPENFGAAGGPVHRASHDEPPPPALRSTCADAGLLAERFTCTDPDGSCVASGLGTFFPPASAVAGVEDDSLAATVEHAVRILRVRDIVVCVSLEHLPTYPSVRERLKQGMLRLYDWFFNTESGGPFAFNPVTGRFGLLMTFAEGGRA